MTQTGYLREGLAFDLYFDISWQFTQAEDVPQNIFGLMLSKHKSFYN